MNEELKVIISAEVSKFKQGLKDAQSSLNGFSGVAKKAVSAVGSGLKTMGKAALDVGKTVAKGVAIGTAALAGVGVAATNAYADYEQLVGGVETLFGDSADVVKNYAKEAYKTAGISANEYMEQATSFSASLIQSLGGDTKAAAEYANRAIVDMSDNANKMGTSMESIQNAYQGFAKQNYTMLDNLKLGYGGTQQEMQRLIADAAKMTAEQEKLGITVDANSMSFDNVVNAISVMQEHLGIAGATADEAFSTISGSLNMMKSAWKNLLVGIADGNQDLKVLVGNMVDTVVTAVGNIAPKIVTMLPRISEGIQQLINQIMPILPPMLQQLLPELINGAVGLINGLVAAAPQFVSLILLILPELINGITQIFEGIVAALPELVQVILDALPSLITSICDGLIKSTDLVVNAFVTLFNGFTQALPLIIQALSPQIPTLVSGIINGLLSCIDSLVTGFVSLFNAFAIALPQIINAIIPKVPDIIISLVQTLVNNIGLLVDGFVSLFSGFMQALPIIISNIVPRIPEIITSIVGVLIENIPVLVDGFIQLFLAFNKALPDIIAEIVKCIPDIIQGIVDGLLNLAGDVFDAAKELGKSLWDGFKSFLGIHSPSTLMMEAGQYAAQGAIDGVDSKDGEAWKIAEDFGRNVNDGFASIYGDVQKTGESIGKGMNGGLASQQSSIGQSASKIGNDINIAFQNVKKISTDLANSMGNTFNQAFKSVSNIFNNIKNGITDKMNSAKNSVSSAISRMKSFFNFSWSLPKLKMPHISITGRFSLSPPSVPHFSIQWYKRGGVFDKTTLFQYGNGQLGGLGENGAEAVVPLENNTEWLDKIADKIADKIGTSGPIIMQVDGKTFAEISVDSINALTRQRGGLALNLV